MQSKLFRNTKRLSVLAAVLPFLSSFLNGFLHKWIKTNKIDENGCNRMKLDENNKTWWLSMNMDENGLKWINGWIGIKKDEKVWKWMKIDENGWKGMKMNKR